MDEFQKRELNWTIASGIANWVMAIAALVTMAYSIYSVQLLYTQTPLWEGNRPLLEHYVVCENTNEKDENGKYQVSTTVKIHNLSNEYPAKGVNVLFNVGGISPCYLTCEHGYQRKNFKGDDLDRVTLDSIPPDAWVELRFIQNVESFDAMKRTDREPDGVFDPQELVFKYSTAGWLSRVYTDYGTSNEMTGKSEMIESYIPEDYRSEEGRKRHKEWKEKMIKEGKLLNLNVF